MGTDCNSPFVWVQASQHVPTNLDWSLNGKISPAYKENNVVLNIPALALSGIAPEYCSNLNITAKAETNNAVTADLAVQWTANNQYEVNQGIADLKSVKVFLDGQVVASIDYTPISPSLDLRVILSLVGLLGLALIWSAYFIISEQWRKRKERLRERRKEMKAAKSAKVKNEERRPRDPSESSMETTDSTHDKNDPWKYTNELRQRRNRHKRTKDRQKKAVREMKEGALRKFKTFLPEDPMAVAVWLETSVCHLEDFEECYGITLFDIAKLIHKHLLENLKTEGAKGMSWEQPEWLRTQLIRDGYFFVVVVMAELLLEGFLGSGIFTSRGMDQDSKFMVTLSLALGLVFVLPFMMSMSRNASPYLYQLVLSAMPTVLCRDLTGGIVLLIIPMITILSVGIPLTGSVAKGFILMAICFLFGMFMLLLTMMYLFRVPDPHVLLPNGRSPVLLLFILASLMVPFILTFTIEMESTIFWVGMHAVALLTADLIMAWRIRSMSREWNMWLPKLIKLSKEMKDGKNTDAKVSALTRSQREEAMWIVNRKIPDRDSWKTYRETETLGFWEYFFMAMEDLKKVNMGTPERRSGELFDGNANEIVHGVMYFIILGFSAIPLFFTKGTASVVSRGVLYSMIAFLLCAGTIELFVKQIADAKQKESHDLLFPASKRIVTRVEAKMHETRLAAYSSVITSFQLTALRWFLLATTCVYLLEPASLFVALPFSAGYNLVLYSMVSRMFLSGFADRAHVAVLVGVCIGVIIWVAFSVASLFTINIAPLVVFTCLLIRALRFIALSYATFDSGAPVLITNIIMDLSRSTIFHLVLTTSLSLLFFWCGEVAILNINQTFFGLGATTETSSAAIFFVAVLATILINFVVYGFHPITRLFFRKSYAEWESVVEYRVICFLAFISGFVYLYLSPLSLGALLGFLTATIIYAHTMRHLVLQPRNTWHNTIDPNDIPMTSGKRILDGGGLTQVKPEVREQEVADKLKKGFINASPLLFENGGLGDQVLEFVERKRTNFRKSALCNIIASPDANDPDDLGLSGDGLDSDDEDMESKGENPAEKNNKPAVDKDGNTFLQSIVYNLMDSLVEDCRSGNTFVYLCDADALYKAGFIALGIRRKQQNVVEAKKEDTGGRNGNNLFRASPLWREQATNRLNIYIGVDQSIIQQRDKQLPEHDEQAEMWLGFIAEAMFHEFVEDATRSHALSSCAELAMLDARRDGYLPRTVRAQLDRMAKSKMTRVQHIFKQTEHEIAKREANAKRIPVGWRYDRDSWMEVCNVEKEIALEIGDYCETLIRKGGDLMSMFLSIFRGRMDMFYATVNSLTKSSLRLWYTALRGDMEVHREVCAYLRHLDIAPGFCGSFSFLLFVHKYLARPVFERLVWMFAWSVSPLYIQLFSPKWAKKRLDPPHAKINVAEKRIKVAFSKYNKDARPVLFEVFQVPDNGQTIIPGILAQVVDEMIVMRMKELKSYWMERQSMCYGRQPFLKFSRNVQELVEKELDPETNAMHQNVMCHKAQDLLILGHAGSAVKTKFKPEQDKVDVVVDGSATIFYVSGGVTTCMMQLINHEGIMENFNLYVLAEMASNSTPRIACPTECVKAIYPIPLHDVTPVPEASIHADKPYFELSLRKQRTTTWVLRARFHPLLRELIRGCCELQGVDDRSSQVNEYFSEVIVALYEYFEQYDWNDSWSDGLTWQVWVQSWMMLLEEKPKEVQRLWAPTIPGLQEALIFFSQALRSLCSELPPADLYHSSHHGIGSLKGIVHKQRFKSRLIVWDHGILLRERLDQLCAEDQLLHPFTRNAIIGLTRLTARLVYNSADIICPCTDVDMYRKWICLIAGRPYHGPFYKRIQPIANGTEPLIDKLCHKPIENYYEDPALQNVPEGVAVEDPHHVHVVMLSHVLPIKDVENAIRAAHHIVHIRGMTVYRLHVFGGLDKDPKYVARCKAVITELKLEDYVTLHGAAMKFFVFPKADLFLNSSFSEGLPMAILEAEMAKVPVVCTDVGGSRQVVPDDRCRAPPRDPTSLGDAQILTLCGFVEEADDSKLNALVLSDKAKEERHRQGEILFKMANEFYTEQGTYDRHFQTMMKYATAQEDPSGNKFNPPPFSVKVSLPINVSVQSAAPEKRGGAGTGEEEAAGGKADPVGLSGMAKYLRGGLYSSSTLQSKASTASSKGKGKDGLVTDGLAAYADPRSDSHYGDGDDSSDDENPMNELVPRLPNTSSTLEIDMEYIRNIRTGSHVPDDDLDLPEMRASRASRYRASKARNKQSLMRSMFTGRSSNARARAATKGSVASRGEAGASYRYSKRLMSLLRFDRGRQSNADTETGSVPDDENERSGRLGTLTSVDLSRGRGTTEESLDLEKGRGGIYDRPNDLDVQVYAHDVDDMFETESDDEDTRRR